MGHLGIIGKGIGGPEVAKAYGIPGMTTPHSIQKHYEPIIIQEIQNFSGLLPSWKINW